MSSYSATPANNWIPPPSLVTTRPSLTEVTYRLSSARTPFDKPLCQSVSILHSAICSSFPPRFGLVWHRVGVPQLVANNFHYSNGLRCWDPLTGKDPMVAWPAAEHQSNTNKVPVWLPQRPTLKEMHTAAAPQTAPRSVRFFYTHTPLTPHQDYSV